MTNIVGKAKTVANAKIAIDKLKNDIDKFDCKIKWEYRIIDWGTRSAGQGKRSGKNMIKGSMSGAPIGKKTYQYVDLSGYQECKKDFKYFSKNRAFHYVKARKFGCNHIEARYYATKYF